MSKGKTKRTLDEEIKLRIDHLLDMEKQRGNEPYYAAHPWFLRSKS